MNKKELKILDNVYAAEIDAAMTKGIYCYQSKSKLVEELVDEGYLQKVEFKFPNKFGEITIKGYQLTTAGNLAYCSSLDGIYEIYRRKQLFGHLNNALFTESEAADYLDISIEALRKYKLKSYGLDELRKFKEAENENIKENN